MDNSINPAKIVKKRNYVKAILNGIKQFSTVFRALLCIKENKNPAANILVTVVL